MATAAPRLGWRAPTRFCAETYMQRHAVECAINRLSATAPVAALLGRLRDRRGDPTETNAGAVAELSRQ
jgi:hypothetical protein